LSKKHRNSTPAPEPQLRSSLRELLKTRPMTLGSIALAMGLHKKRELHIIKDELHEMLDRGELNKSRDAVFTLMGSCRQLQGKFCMTTQGFGFVVPEDGDGQDIFIPARYVNQAMDGDIVKVTVMEETGPGGKGPSGTITEVVGHKRSGLVGELVSGRNSFMVRPLSKKVPNDIPVSGDLHGAGRGDWVEVSLLPGDTKHGDTLRCEIIRRVGRVGEIDDDINAVVLEFQLRPPYTEEEEKEAAKLRPGKIERVDLTKELCLTIDPTDAKDFDDAISISKGERPGQVVVGVHIADVAAWIKPGSDWDAKAADRSFTAYIPGRTLPMLPRNLTKKISLTEGDESPAHSLHITVDTKTGEILSSRRFHSTIKVAARLSYNEVEEFIKSDAKKLDRPAPVKKALNSLFDVYQAMRKRRGQTEKFLDIETAEIRALRDDNTGEMLGILRKNQGDADRLVEEFMLAANSLVAQELSAKAIPGVYRKHDPPDEDKIRDFSAFVEDVFDFPIGDILSGREACRRFLERLAAEKFKDIVTMSFLRSLNRATYDKAPGLHFGLGKGIYCHFTSPIRRYPDLFVHQQLWLLDKSAKLSKLRTPDDAKATAADCTDKEKNNDDAYYAANDRLKLHYLKKLLDAKELELYEAVIFQVSASGILADIPTIGLTAFVPSESLSGNFHKHHGKLVAERGSARFKPGDIIYLKLDKIDFIKGSAIFSPA